MRRASITAASAAAGLAMLAVLSGPALARDGVTRASQSCERLLNACIPRPPAACQMGEGGPAPETEPTACAAARDRWLACNDSVIVSCGAGLDEPGDGVETIAGTVWEGIGLRDGDYVFRFCANGVLNYTTPTGTWDTGRWIHSGREVLVSMNQGFAVYFGVIEGDVLSGYADNTRAETWEWRLVRNPGAEPCELGTPS